MTESISNNYSDYVRLTANGKSNGKYLRLGFNQLCSLEQAQIKWFVFREFRDETKIVKVHKSCLQRAVEIVKSV